MNEVEFIAREMIAPTLMKELPERGLRRNPDFPIAISPTGIQTRLADFTGSSDSIEIEMRDAFKKMVVSVLIEKIYARAYEVPLRGFIKGELFTLLSEVNIEDFVLALPLSSSEAVVICSPTMLTLLVLNGYPISQQNMVVDQCRVIINPYADDHKPTLICEPGWGSFNFDQLLIGNEEIMTDFTFTLDEEKITSIGYLPA